MRNYEATEQAYKNGYAKGYEDGKKASEPVVHGEWIDSYSIQNGKIRYGIDCSVCEEVFPIHHHDQEYWKRKLKRCFCCGAFMDGGNEDA